jgi:hypothetical protein
MDSLTDEESAHTQACYAVAMHLHANRKVGKASIVILGLAIAAAAYFRSLWFLAGGLALCVVTYFVVIQLAIAANPSAGREPLVHFPRNSGPSLTCAGSTSAIEMQPNCYRIAVRLQSSCTRSAVLLQS